MLTNHGHIPNSVSFIHPHSPSPSPPLSLLFAQSLQHLPFPDFLSFSLSSSPHCPVWATTAFRLSLCFIQHHPRIPSRVAFSTGHFACRYTAFPQLAPSREYTSTHTRSLLEKGLESIKNATVPSVCRLKFGWQQTHSIATPSGFGTTPT